MATAIARQERKDNRMTPRDEILSAVIGFCVIAAGIAYAVQQASESYIVPQGESVIQGVPIDIKNFGLPKEEPEEIPEIPIICVPATGQGCA